MIYQLINDFPSFLKLKMHKNVAIISHSLLSQYLHQYF